jgi:hypothetical protein
MTQVARKTLKDRIAEAATAHTDLTMFYGVVALLEGGTVSADADPDAQRIIAICKKAAGKCLRRMDDAINDAVRRHAVGETLMPGGKDGG